MLDEKKAKINSFIENNQENESTSSETQEIFNNYTGGKPSFDDNKFEEPKDKPLKKVRKRKPPVKKYKVRKIFK